MAKRVTKQKPKIKTGNRALDRLYGAIVNYIEKKGGSVVVIGNVAVNQECSPFGEPINKYNYSLVIGITGKTPTKVGSQLTQLSEEQK